VFYDHKTGGLYKDIIVGGLTRYNIFSVTRNVKAESKFRWWNVSEYQLGKQYVFKPNATVFTTKC